MKISKVIVFLMLGSDHLANVRSLQNIYQQTYDNITLIALNDCCDNFQSERFFYTLNDKEHKGIKQIIFAENKYPKGDIQNKRTFLRKIPGDYVITLHAGDRFVKKDALKKAVMLLKSNKNCAAVVTGKKALEANGFVDSCRILFSVSGWTEYDCKTKELGEGEILSAMQNEAKLLFQDKAICYAARLNCFQPPVFEEVDLSPERFCKTKEEANAEAFAFHQSKIVSILHVLTHRRMIALYGVVWLILCLVFTLISPSSVSGSMKSTVGVICILEGFFAFGMLVIKVLWKLRIEGKL